MDELKARMSEELDYHLEAKNQRHFATAFRGDEDVLVPDALVDTTHVIVTEWVDGTPLARSSPRHPGAARRGGHALLEFLLRAPNRARLLHADPHPGNFRITEDGRLAVFDFGAVNRLPHGLPPSLGRLLTEALAGEAEALEAGLRDEGFIRKGIDIDPEALLEYLAPLVEPLLHDEFTFYARVAARCRRHVAGPAPAAVPHRAQAQPAAGVPPDPPGVARRHRGAQPDRRHRPAARDRLRATCRASTSLACRRPPQLSGCGFTTRWSRACPRCCAGTARLHARRSSVAAVLDPARPRDARQGRGISSAGGPHVAHTGSRMPAARHPRSVSSRSLTA